MSERFKLSSPKGASATAHYALLPLHTTQPKTASLVPCRLLLRKPGYSQDLGGGLRSQAAHVRSSATLKHLEDSELILRLQTPLEPRPPSGGGAIARRLLAGSPLHLRLDRWRVLLPGGDSTNTTRLLWIAIHLSTSISLNAGAGETHHGTIVKSSYLGPG